MMIFQFNIILLVETFNISTSIQNFFVTNNFEILHLSDVILKDFFHLFFSATSKEEILGSIMKPLHSDNTIEISSINSLLLLLSYIRLKLTMLKPLSVEMFRNFCTYTFHSSYLHKSFLVFVRSFEEASFPTIQKAFVLPLYIKKGR